MPLFKRNKTTEETSSGATTGGSPGDGTGPGDDAWNAGSSSLPDSNGSPNYGGDLASQPQLGRPPHFRPGFNPTRAATMDRPLTYADGKLPPSRTSSLYWGASVPGPAASQGGSRSQPHSRSISNVDAIAAASLMTMNGRDGPAPPLPYPYPGPGLSQPSSEEPTNASPKMAVSAFNYKLDTIIPSTYKSFMEEQTPVRARSPQPLAPSSLISSLSPPDANTPNADTDPEGRGQHTAPDGDGGGVTISYIPASATSFEFPVLPTPGPVYPGPPPPSGSGSTQHRLSPTTTPTTSAPIPTFKPPPPPMNAPEPGHGRSISEPAVKAGWDAAAKGHGVPRAVSPSEGGVGNPFDGPNGYLSGVGSPTNGGGGNVTVTALDGHSYPTPPPQQQYLHLASAENPYAHASRGPSPLSQSYVAARSPSGDHLTPIVSNDAHAQLQPQESSSDSTHGSEDPEDESAPHRPAYHPPSIDGQVLNVSFAKGGAYYPGSPLPFPGAPLPYPGSVRGSVSSTVSLLSQNSQTSVGREEEAVEAEGAVKNDGEESGAGLGEALPTPTPMATTAPASTTTATITAPTAKPSPAPSQPPSQPASQTPAPPSQAPSQKNKFIPLAMPIPPNVVANSIASRNLQQARANANANGHVIPRKVVPAVNPVQNSNGVNTAGSKGNTTGISESAFLGSGDAAVGQGANPASEASVAMAPQSGPNSNSSNPSHSRSSSKSDNPPTSTSTSSSSSSSVTTMTTAPTTAPPTTTGTITLMTSPPRKTHARTAAKSARAPAIPNLKVPVPPVRDKTPSSSPTAENGIAGSGLGLVVEVSSGQMGVQIRSQTRTPPPLTMRARSPSPKLRVASPPIRARSTPPLPPLPTSATPPSGSRLATPGDELVPPPLPTLKPKSPSGLLLDPFITTPTPALVPVRLAAIYPPAPPVPSGPPPTTTVPRSESTPLTFPHPPSSISPALPPLPPPSQPTTALPPSSSEAASLAPALTTITSRLSSLEESYRTHTAALDGRLDEMDKRLFRKLSDMEQTMATNSVVNEVNTSLEERMAELERGYREHTVSVDERLDKMDARFDSLEAGVAGAREGKGAGVNESIDEMGKRLEGFEAKMDDRLSRVENLLGKLLILYNLPAAPK